MGNIPSRSFEEGFPEGTDNQFLAHFLTNHFSLPTPFTPDSQPGSWKLVTPPSGIISAVISLLRKTPNTSEDPTATIGNSGYAIPHLVTRTLTSSTYKENPTAWNKASCSWPLLDPSSKVNSTMANLLPLWSLRLCYEKLPGSGDPRRSTPGQPFLDACFANMIRRWKGEDPGPKATAGAPQLCSPPDH
jgi:hypothetical protein